MRCPYCGHTDTKVVETKPVEDSMAVIRRRLCRMCNKKFTSRETLELTIPMVIKSDGSRQPFMREKLRNSIIHACQKLPISYDEIEKVVDEIEYELKDYLLEVPSKVIGEKVLQKLLKLHPIAYIRFASVYYQYADIDTFISELNKLKEKLKNGTKP